MQCPDCGHENLQGIILCENCGADLYDVLLEKVTTTQLEDSKQTNPLRLGEPSSSRPVLFYVGRAQMPIAVERMADQIVGRVDPDTGDLADIDLTEYGAQDAGMSRQHAVLDASADKPTLTDLGSYNGTYVNGVRLVPKQPYTLESGDQVRFARLTTQVYYK